MTNDNGSDESRQRRQANFERSLSMFTRFAMIGACIAIMASALVWSVRASTDVQRDDGLGLIRTVGAFAVLLVGMFLL